MPDTNHSTPVLRIIDANLNRARESLRVIEESARFLGECAALSLRLKKARHDLTHARSLLSGEPDALLAARDTTGDVGTALHTAGERERRSLKDIRDAAFSRLAEALRVLEEYAKLDSSRASTAFKNLRYDCYGLEQAFGLRAPLLERLQQASVCLLFTEELCRTDPARTLAAAIDGGITMVQLREKNLPDRELLERTRRLRDSCAERGALYVVNDRVDAALLSGADGVHVGQDDCPPNDARRLLGESRLVGVSTHTPEEARQAAAGDVDFIGLGAMFTTPTKPDAQARGPELLRRVAKLNLAIPVFAVGGVTPENVAALRDAGARRVAVSRAVLDADDPGAVAERLVRILA